MKMFKSISCWRGVNYLNKPGGWVRLSRFSSIASGIGGGPVNRERANGGGSHWSSRHHHQQQEKRAAAAQRPKIPTSLNARSRRRGGHQGNSQTGHCCRNQPPNIAPVFVCVVYYNRLVFFSSFVVVAPSTFFYNWSSIKITSHQNNHNRWIVKKKKILFLLCVVKKNVEKDIGCSSVAAVSNWKQSVSCCVSDWPKKSHQGGRQQQHKFLIFFFCLSEMDGRRGNGRYFFGRGAER